MKVLLPLVALAISHLGPIYLTGWPTSFGGWTNLAIGGAAALFLILCFVGWALNCFSAAPVGTPAPASVARTRKAGSMLDILAWFCRGETRECLRLSASDLRKDVRAMRKQGCGRLHILAVRFWTTTTTIVPIVWDGCVRISKKVPFLGAWIRAVSAFLRKIDPPRLG